MLYIEIGVGFQEKKIVTLKRTDLYHKLQKGAAVSNSKRFPKTVHPH